MTTRIKGCKIERMYHNIEEIIQEILKETPPTLNFSLEELAQKIAERTGEQPSKSSVKRFLNEMGIIAETGKVRRWVWRHNPGAK